MIEVRGKYNTARVFVDAVDEGVLTQLTGLCNQPFVEGLHIRIMPDTHVGMGCTIGTTMTIKDKVVPGHVGVDIGCGVYVARLREKHIDFDRLDRVIRGNVPSGFDVRKHPHDFVAQLRLDALRCKSHLKNMRRLELSVGSLGGGNHFIEVATDAGGNNYLSIHTGSRNLGKQVAEHYQNVAVRALGALLASAGRTKVPKDMAYLEGENLEDYLWDMQIAQEFADLNRQAIAQVLGRGMNWTVEESFITTHNYVDMQERMLRKGAVAAHRGQKLIIPINMRDGSIIAVGKGNAEWNFSAPHGAGRLMSRSQGQASAYPR